MGPVPGKQFRSCGRTRPEAFGAGVPSAQAARRDPQVLSGACRSQADASRCAAPTHRPTCRRAWGYESTGSAHRHLQGIAAALGREPREDLSHRQPSPRSGHARSGAVVRRRPTCRKRMAALFASGSPAPRPLYPGRAKPTPEPLDPPDEWPASTASAEHSAPPPAARLRGAYAGRALSQPRCCSKSWSSSKCGHTQASFRLNAPEAHLEALRCPHFEGDPFKEHRQPGLHPLSTSCIGTITPQQPSFR